MARAFELWVDRDTETGRVTRCGMSPLSKQDESHPGHGPWERLARASEGPLATGGPWALLLRLLNFERRIQPQGWPFGPTGGLLEWIKANEAFPSPDWAAWKAFGEELGVPYFVTDDHGRPVLWFPATDGEWYGFMFHFGLQPGQWNWWVAGQPLRYEPGSGGSTLAIMGETHKPRPTLLSLEELLNSLPSGLFEVNAEERLSLREALDMELQRHAAEERDRCRFFVYHPLSPGHGNPWGEDTSFGLQTLEAVRKHLCGYAWLWLSPLAGLWPVMRHEFGAEVNGDPNIDKPETAEKLGALTPRQKYAMTRLGTSAWPQLGHDPLADFRKRVRRGSDVAPAGAPRIVSSLVQQAQDEFWRAVETPRGRQARQRETREARRRLIRSATIREHYVTSDIFGAVALQLEWAVEAELTLLACPHPGCGVAFFREAHYHGRFCPAHRGDAARQARSRARRGTDARATASPPPE